jgi:hypothetical protein
MRGYDHRPRWKVYSGCNRSSRNHQSQETARHKLLKEQSPNKQLSRVVSTNAGLNEGLILRIARYEFRIEVILLNNCLHLSLNLALSVRR